MYYRVRGDVVVGHDCDCPYCTHASMTKKRVDRIAKARTPEQAMDLVLGTVFANYYDVPEWEDEASVEVTPVPDDQWMTAEGYLSLPGLEGMAQCKALITPGVK